GGCHGNRDWCEQKRLRDGIYRVEMAVLLTQKVRRAFLVGLDEAGEPIEMQAAVEQNRERQQRRRKAILRSYRTQIRLVDTVSEEKDRERQPGRLMPRRFVHSFPADDIREWR